jgi:hypothetical protein
MSLKKTLYMIHMSSTDASNRHLFYVFLPSRFKNEALNRLPKRFATCTRWSEGGGAAARQREQGGGAAARGRRRRGGARVAKPRRGRGGASEVEAQRREGGGAAAQAGRRERGGGIARATTV